MATDQALGDRVVRAVGQAFGPAFDWYRRLAAEVVQLPDTLARLREGAANFQLVGERLAASSAALEQITRLYESTVADGAKRMADAAEAVRQQVDRLPGAGAAAEAMGAVLGELQRALGALARSNPFWPSSAGPGRNP